MNGISLLDVFTVDMVAGFGWQVAMFVGGKAISAMINLYHTRNDR